MRLTQENPAPNMQRSSSNYFSAQKVPINMRQFAILNEMLPVNHYKKYKYLETKLLTAQAMK